jgi:hypothetical protein
MNRRESSRLGRGILVLASCGLLALTAGATAATAGTEGPTATAAKKKCKKGKESATAAKKKCKSKKKFGGTTTGPVVTLPGPTTDTTPTSPATLTWSNPDIDLDLYVWENGSFGGRFGAGIPSSTPAVDDDSLGPETFTASPNTRRFTYGICAFDVPASEDTDFTLTVQDQTGATHVFNQNNFTPPGPITDPSDWRKAIFGGFDPDPDNDGDWCEDISEI